MPSRPTRSPKSGSMKHADGQIGYNGPNGQPPGACQHTAQLYTDCSALNASLLSYVQAALARGDAAVAIAVPENIDALLQGLSRAGCDTFAAQARGQLVCRDANACLADLMDGEHADQKAFQELIGGLIQQTRARFAGISAYGELVNLLWQQGNIAAAHDLERWWNALIERYGFTLLCGYRMNVFDERAQASLEMICSTHSHVIPSEDGERMDAAVGAALHEVLPEGDIDAMRVELAARARRHAAMPQAQVVLMALQDLLPSLAQEVRFRAEAHFRRLPA